MRHHRTAVRQVTRNDSKGERGPMSIGKLSVAAIASCCVLAAWLAWACAPALAAAPETPEISVGSPVPPTTAVVQGVLNPGMEGAPGTYELGTYEFLYKQGKAGCEGGGKAPASPGISLGAGKEAVSETLQGLTPDSEYTVCLLMRDGIKGEQAITAPVTFTTSPALEAPVTSEPASAVTATSATLEGELSPGGAAGPLTYQFDYNTNGGCMGGQSTVPVEATEAKQLQVHSEAAELEPNDNYTFCLVATNAFGEQAQGSEVSLQTQRQAPTITGTSVTNITSSEATLNAQVYPHGELTSYHIEYGPSEAYGTSTPEVSVSAQHGPSGIQAQLTGLTPNSEYHYQIVATNITGTEHTPDATFTTSEASVASSQGLPDNRAYEMVTPPDNEDSNVYVPKVGFGGSLSQGVVTTRPFQVAGDGSAIMYLGDATSGGGEGQGGQGLGNQFLARRQSNGGWMTTSIQPAGLFDTIYQGFSNDLSVGVLQSGAYGEPESPPLSEEARGEGYKILYARATSEDGYRPIFTKAVQLNRPVESFGTNGGVYAVGMGDSGLVFAGGSAGFSDLLFEADDALMGGEGVLETELEGDVRSEIAKGKVNNYLYDSVDGRPGLIDVSPGGRVVSNATFGGLPLYDPENASSSDETYPGKNPPDFDNAISADGSRVYWTSIETVQEEYGLPRRSGLLVFICVIIPPSRRVRL
jgi:hypothetical protein